MACRNNYVYVVWNDGDPISGAKIKFRRSSDYGATWGGATDIANGSFANLYALGPYVYMAYVGTDGKVKFRYSANNGASWSAEQTAAPNAKVGYTPGPSIVVSPTGHAHIAWTDSRFEASGDTGEVFYVHGIVPVNPEADTCPTVCVDETEFTPIFSVTSMPYGFYVRYEGKEAGLLTVYNIVGRLVKTQKITQSSEVRLGELPSGIYFLTLKTRNDYLKAKGIYLKY